MIEYRKTWDWEYIRIDEMSTEHLLKTIDVIKYRYDDWRLEMLSWEVWIEEFEKWDNEIHTQYQAMHNELTVRLAKKLLLNESIGDVE